MGLDVLAETVEVRCVAYSAGRAGTAGRGASGGARAGIPRRVLFANEAYNGTKGKS